MGPDEGGGSIIGDEALVVAEKLQPALPLFTSSHKGAVYPVGFAADGYPVARGCAIAQASSETYIDGHCMNLADQTRKENLQEPTAKT